MTAHLPLHRAARHLTPPQEQRRRLLARVIQQSGLEPRAWAIQVAWRPARTIERWLEGSSPVPAAIHDRLREELRNAGAGADD